MNSDTIFIIGSDTTSCQELSKREALQSISRIYDPRTVHELCKQALDWDETLSETKQQVYYKLHEDLTPSSSLTIPRFFLSKTCHTDGMVFYNLFENFRKEEHQEQKRS